MQARETGIGGHIDCSMLGSLIGVAALQTSQYFGTGKAPEALGSAHPRNAPYRSFEASDDYFIIAAGNDKLWCKVADAVGKPELAKDPRFETQFLRAQNQDDLISTGHRQNWANIPMMFFGIGLVRSAGHERKYQALPLRRYHDGDTQPSR